MLFSGYAVIQIPGFICGVCMYLKRIFYNVKVRHQAPPRLEHVIHHQWIGGSCSQHPTDRGGPSLVSRPTDDQNLSQTEDAITGIVATVIGGTTSSQTEDLRKVVCELENRIKCEIEKRLNVLEKHYLSIR